MGRITNNTLIETGPYQTANCVLGTECIFAGAPYGALWEYTVTVPSEGTGQIALGQIIEDELWQNTTAGQTTTRCTADATGTLHYWADSGFPYSAATSVPGGGSVTWNPPIGPHDEPEFDLPYATYGQAARIFQAEDYWMYEPQYVAPRSTIWVTLEQSSWSFQNSWTEVTPTPAPTATPSFSEGTPLAASGVTGVNPSASTTLPIWPKTLTGLNYAPCNINP